LKNYVKIKSTYPVVRNTAVLYTILTVTGSVKETGKCVNISSSPIYGPFSGVLAGRIRDWLIDVRI